MSKENLGKRVAIYARVSTRKQADNELSITDQIDWSERWIAEHGARKVATFIDAGASATRDSRTEFQAMIALAMSEDHPVDIILVHSLSRLFRNALHFMQYKEKLLRHKVRIISITQAFGNDPTADLAVGMLALFDEYHSAENSKHVKRTMLANAANGFWNGQTPPIGYKTVAAPQPKGKDRRRLAIDPETQHIPQLVFATYVQGYGGGPIGITKLAQLMNERGERLRGKPFSVSNVHAILTNPAYIGIVFYNQRDARTGEARPVGEWVPIPVPPLISEELFCAAKAQMAARDPKMGSAAVKTNGNLLTGHVICGCAGDGCGGGMTTSTGKSGQYRYYACHRRAASGATQCPGRRIRIDALDDLVVTAVADQILANDRLKVLLSAWIDRSEEVQLGRREGLKQLRARLTMLGSESANVIKLVRSGLYPPDDPQVAAEIANIAAQQRAIAADISALERKIDDGERRITPELLERFGSLLRQNLLGQASAARRDYIRLLVDRVEVGHREIRITGSKATLSRAATGVPLHMVPKTERRWCTRQDSNL